MNAGLPTIGLTLGDAAGIGPEIISAALASGRLDPSCHYRVIGAAEGATPGQPTETTARAALAALEDKARRWPAAGEIAGVVTGPIHKARMKTIGFDFPGQTEFFAQRARCENFAMCLTGGALTVALVTIHVPLRSVADALTTVEIVRVGLLLAEFLRQRHGRVPRLAVAGLNPHAGEAGAFGREEIEIIEPAVALLRGELGDLAECSGPALARHGFSSRGWR